ncbi:hypothetical protein FQR65_LT00519 [Abscondita terminalis]|nr:hypothetical protein FQR65_LT00519 [Abscondita terminalis]
MSKSRSESEYSFQYFGFTPETFWKDFVELALEEMSNTVKGTMKSVSTLKSLEKSEEDLGQHILEVFDKWCNQTNTILNEVNPTIKEFFTVPSNVLLKSDTMYKKSFSDEEVQLLEKEVAALELEYSEQLRDISKYEMLVNKINSFEPLIEKTKESTNILKQVVNTIDEIKALKKIFKMHSETKHQLEKDDNQDSDGDDNDYLNKFVDVGLFCNNCI